MDETKGERTCWALLKRWISSKNNTVLLRINVKWMTTVKDVDWCIYLPVNDNAPFASSNMARTSEIPATVALSSLNVAWVCFASSLAKVVFPHLRNHHSINVTVKNYIHCGTYPGGPQNIMLPIEPVSNIFFIKDPGPNRWLCPINSSKDVGRSRSANGAADCRFGAPIFPRFTGAENRHSGLRFREELGESVLEPPGAASSTRVDVSGVSAKIGAKDSCLRACEDDVPRPQPCPFTLKDCWGSRQALSRCWLIFCSGTSREQTGLRVAFRQQKFLADITYQVTCYTNRGQLECASTNWKKLACTK